MLSLICPPPTGGTEAVLRENGERQVWHRVRLDHHQLNYYPPHEDLWPGWEVWHHNGRYLTDPALRHLNWLMCPLGNYPEPPELHLEVEPELAEMV